MRPRLLPRSSVSGQTSLRPVSPPLAAGIKAGEASSLAAIDPAECRRGLNQRDRTPRPKSTIRSVLLVAMRYVTRFAGKVPYSSFDAPKKEPRTPEDGKWPLPCHAVLAS